MIDDLRLSARLLRRVPALLRRPIGADEARDRARPLRWAGSELERDVRTEPLARRFLEHFADRARR